MWEKKNVRMEKNKTANLMSMSLSRVKVKSCNFFYVNIAVLLYCG